MYTASRVSGQRSKCTFQCPDQQSWKRIGRRMKRLSCAAGPRPYSLQRDDAPLRELASTVLGKYGYTVIEAVDGQDAIIRFRENQDRIQLVVLDGIMPKMNGKDAWREIKAIRAGVKAVFVSGYAEDIFTKDGIPDKEVAFIQKPAPPATLLR